jgi:hypothetical protein
LNLKAWNFFAAALLEELTALLALTWCMPVLLADLFELIIFDIAMEVEGKCYYMFFCWTKLVHSSRASLFRSSLLPLILGWSKV